MESLGFDLDQRNSQTSEGTGPYCCVATCIQDVTMWLHPIINPETGFTSFRLYSFPTTMFEAECWDMPCDGELVGITCEEAVKDFNDNNDPMDATVAGEGTQKDPFRFQLIRKKKIGCCKNLKCATVRTTPNNGQSGEFTPPPFIDIYGGGPSLLDDDRKKQLLRYHISLWWLGGSGSSLSPGLTWPDLKCCE